MYKFTPEKKPRNAYALVLAAFIVFVLLAAFTVAFSQYKAFYELGAIVSIVIVIQITARYLSASYSYILDKSNFVVIKTQGRRSSQLCNISLSTGLKLIKKDEYKALSTEEKKNIKICYNYCQNLVPLDSSYYIFEFNGKNAMLIFEADDELSARMRDVMGKPSDAEAKSESLLDD